MSQSPLAPPPQTGGPLDNWLYLLWRRLTATGQMLWSSIVPGSSADVAAVVTDETGSPGSLVFSGNPTLAGITNSGNLVFTGTGNRIKGLFGGVPIADRVGFQTTEAASYTALQVIPSDGGTGGYIFANGLPDVENTNYIYIGATSGVCQFVSNASGTGTLAPMTFHVGSPEKARIATDGTFTAGGLSTAPALKVTPVASQARWIEVTAATSGGNPQLATTAGELLLPQNIVIPKTSGKGIQVDTASPSFGWRDLLGPIEVKAIGATDPVWKVYRGSIFAYEFDGATTEAFFTFHLPHDMLPSSTSMLIHTHWSQIVVDTGGTAGVPGVAEWNYDISYADGHGTAGGAADPFTAPATFTVTQQASTTQYGHMIAEVEFANNGGTGGKLDTATMVVDGLLLVRMYRVKGNPADTLDQAPFVHTVDIHYQSTNIGTKQNNPITTGSFYT